MERTSIVSTRAALALLVVLFAVNVYRAATQDVTPAEAWNYDRFIGPGWQESLRHYDANNHFLNTLLARISTRNLRLTELTLRLPGLLGGLLYCLAIWRLCRRLFKWGWAFPAAVAVMTLNPVVVDALSEARGYGMAMALWLWALELMLECLEEFSARKLNLAAMCLALSVAACLGFIVPALGLLGGFAFYCRKPISRDLYLPFVVFLFVLLVLPLNRALVSDFKDATLGWPNAVYLVPVLTLITLGLLRRFTRLVIATSIVCCLIYAAKFPLGAYREAAALAGSREIAKALRADAKQRPVRIATTAELEPIMNYYRSRYRQGNWARIERKVPGPGYDYYVLTDRSMADGLRLRVINRAKGLLLAKPL
jgi:hypothetical protein